MTGPIASPSSPIRQRSVPSAAFLSAGPVASPPVHRPDRAKQIKGLAFALRLIFLAMPLLLAGPVWASETKGVVKIGSDVTIEAGTTVRNVVTLGGQITIHGTVEKSVTACGGSVVLARTAVVGGDITAIGGVIVIAREAEVGGSLTELNSANLYETLAAALSSEWEGWSWVFAVISLSIFLVLLVLALLIAALLPKPVLTVSEAISRSTFKATLWGILGLVTIAPLTLLLTISIVGIALIPLQMIIVVCAVLLGFIAVGQRVGRTVLKLLKRSGRGPVRETLWGLVTLWIIGWIPYIGWMVKASAIVLGLGATLVTRFGTHRPWICAPCAPAAAPPPSSSAGQELAVAGEERAAPTPPLPQTGPPAANLPPDDPERVP
jgi:hypothetical protein